MGQECDFISVCKQYNETQGGTGQTVKVDADLKVPKDEKQHCNCEEKK